MSPGDAHQRFPIHWTPVQPESFMAFAGPSVGQPLRRNTLWRDIIRPVVTTNNESTYLVPSKHVGMETCWWAPTKLGYHMFKV